MEFSCEVFSADAFWKEKVPKYYSAFVFLQTIEIDEILQIFFSLILGS